MVPGLKVPHPSLEFQDNVTKLIDGRDTTSSLLGEARTMLQWLKDQPNRSFAIPEDITEGSDISNILVAMLEYSTTLKDHAMRYVASSIKSCGQDVEALGKLVNMWLGYFLLPCKSH